jgi:hypothetical protein
MDAPNDLEIIGLFAGALERKSAGSKATATCMDPCQVGLVLMICHHPNED